MTDTLQSIGNWCERLYEAKAAELLLYGRALGLSHSEAEDVLHDAFTGLMRMETEPQQPAFYCVRAFRNRALNYKRGMWRRLTRELEWSRWFQPSPADASGEKAAMRCLERLPADQREVIVLKIWHGHTFAEIAELLEESPNTVAGRYRYGMQKLRVALKGKPYERLESIGEPLPLLETAHSVAET